MFIKSKNIKIFCLAFLCGLSSVLIFLLYFKFWAFDLNYPIANPIGDGIGYVAIAQNIIDNGWIADSNRFGYLNSESFFTFDHYPLFSEFIHFSIFKIFSFFTQNPYLIVNLFFILTFFLISFFGFLCLRVYGMSNLISFFLAIHYAFLSYHVIRSTGHLFLTNYSCIPLIMMVVYWFYNNQISLIAKNQKQQFCLAINKYFIFSVLIIIYCAGTGFYYGLYSSLLIFLIWFLKSLKEGKFISKNLTIFFVFFGVYSILFLCIHIPYFSVLTANKVVPVTRTFHDSFEHSLKLISLFIPQDSHLIDQFANISKSWKTSIKEFENSTCYLGILLGFVFVSMIIWIFAKANDYKIIEKISKNFALNSKDIEKISLISSLSFSSLLFIIAGGLIALSFKFVFLRSNARFVVVIAFLCLIALGILVDGLLRKRKLKGLRLFKMILLFVYILSMLDILGKRDIFNLNAILISNIINHTLFKADNKKNSESVDKKNIHNGANSIKIFVDGNKKFIEEIESSLPEGSPVFVMPFGFWPEKYLDSYSSFLFYIDSKKLRYSYPAIPSQKNIEIAKTIFKSLNYYDFIKELKKLGFEGLILNIFEHENCFSDPVCSKLNPKINNLKEKMSEMAGKYIINSENGLFIFIKI